MRVRTKLRLLFLSVIAIGLTVSVVSLYSISLLGEAKLASNESLKAQLTAETLRFQMREEASTEFLDSAATKAPGAEETFAKLHAGWLETTSSLRNLSSEDAGIAASVERIYREIEINIPSIIKRTQNIAKEGQTDEYIGDSEWFFGSLFEQIDDLRDALDARVEETTASANRTERRVVILLVISSIALIVVALVSVILFRNWVMRPVQVLSVATHAIALGDYNTKIPLEGETEFARLARDVEAMSASIENFQEQLVEKERMAAVGEMTASVAHNVRNPLASIRAMAQGGRRDPDLEKEKKQVFGTIMETVDRADRWLKDLLTALRPVKIASAVEDLNAVVEEVVVGSRVFAERKGISLELELDSGLDPIPLDRRKFEQALIVLMTNAVEASPNDGSVSIVVSRHPGPRRRASVCVTDHGHGMTPETLKKLFTPYFTTKKSGVGLGLCLAQKIIFGHRGTIEVESEPDEGSRITIWLPLDPPPLENQAELAERSQDGTDPDPR